MLQVSEHHDKNRYPNFQIPPCAPAAVYSSTEENAAMNVVKKLMECVAADSSLLPFVGDLQELSEVETIFQTNLFI